MPPKAVLLYDGACSLCERAARALSRWDLTRRLDLQDLRTADLARLNPSLRREACEARLHLLESGGRVHAGFGALRRLTSLLPALWWAAPIAYFPGAALLLEPAYDALARARFALSERLRGHH